MFGRKIKENSLHTLEMHVSDRQRFSNFATRHSLRMPLAPTHQTLNSNLLLQAAEGEENKPPVVGHDQPAAVQLGRPHGQHAGRRGRLPRLVHGAAVVAARFPPQHALAAVAGEPLGVRHTPQSTPPARRPTLGHVHRLRSGGRLHTSVVLRLHSTHPQGHPAVQSSAQQQVRSPPPPLCGDAPRIYTTKKTKAMRFIPQKDLSTEY